LSLSGKNFDAAPGSDSSPIGWPPHVAAGAPGSPFRESGTSGPPSGRDASGRFIGGNLAAVTSGLTSGTVRSGEALGQKDAVRAAKQELRRELGEASVVKGSLADAFVELDAIRAYLSEQLRTAGPLTGKGRSRATLTCYLNVIDRQVRIAAAGRVGAPRPLHHREHRRCARGRAGGPVTAPRSRPALRRRR